MDKGNKKLKILIIALIVAALCAVCIIVEIVREVTTFTVTHYNLESPKLSDNMKAVVLSDLHNCSYGKNNEKLLQAIEKEQPDVILVAGDILVGASDEPTDVAEDFMREVRKIAPVYYGNGNHEQRMKEQPEEYGKTYKVYKKSIVKSGVTLLENETEAITWRDDKVNIRGLEIPLPCYKKLSKEKLSQKQIENRIGKADKESFEILIAHNPVYAEQYAKWGADLILSGHLHGGIVRVPFWRGVISPQIRLFPKYSGGHYEVGQSDLIVSRGLGMHTIPIRLFNEAEVVVLNIEGTK